MSVAGKTPRRQSLLTHSSSPRGTTRIETVTVKRTLVVTVTRTIDKGPVSQMPSSDSKE